ncbi:zinc-ribbon domain-containing protein [Streptomyces sp. NPDC014891]|uniref:zinc-ribbon domain-containing protein n=1 Tax=Streptomyces sp. NPDC014891 TaxID=3364929 RepID=UPI00370301DE
MSSLSPRTPVQLCSEPDCPQPAAYRTRSRDAWCDAHITAMLRTGGLEPLEPFTKPTAWRGTRCLACGVEAHYRFAYTVEKNAIGEATCRACYWRRWAEEDRLVRGAYADLTPVPEAVAREIAEKNGYDYLAPLTVPSLAEDPHHVRCRYCERLSAERLGDIAFGCRCQTNPNRARQTTKPASTPARDLLKDSGLSAVEWWDHERNASADWETVTVRARREVSWRCPDCGLRFTKRVLDMAGTCECPDCELKRRAEWQAEYERYEVTPVADIPELLAAWADEADPRMVTVAGSGPLRRFRCPQGHHPRLSPHTYLSAGCPSCRAQDTRETRLAAAEADPTVYGMGAEIASQWHPSKNGRVQLAKTSPRSRKTVWWLDPDCGHEWQETPAQRDKGQRLRCPDCRTILDSLGYHFPEMAAEWSPANPLSAWHVRPTGQTPFVPAWICSTNPEHVWTASLASRTGGSGCPECREHGKSQVELDHHAAAVLAFGAAASGRSLRHDAFVRRTHWLVDITVELDAGRSLVIEYDGSYWHADKHDIDIDKSRDLLAAGYLVARLREHPLAALPIDHPAYAEFVVHATAPSPDATIDRVRQWAMAEDLAAQGFVTRPS